MQIEDRRRASSPGTRRREGGLPGAGLAAVIAALSALAIGLWARIGTDAHAAPATMNRIAEVDPKEIGTALDTVVGSPEQLARFRKLNSCERRLAWVTVARGPGQAPGRIRLKSGNYMSPAFDLGEAPVRVALPFPAPYPTGRGTISVVGTTADAVVALTPPWLVPAQPGVHAVEVTWTPVGCPGAGT